MPCGEQSAAGSEQRSRPHIVIGSFYDAILTEDREAAKADQDLRLLLDDARREDLQGALATYLPNTLPDQG